MKKYLWILSVMILTEFSFAQTELKGTMGVNFISTPSLQDYLNINFNYDLTTFNSAVIFSGEIGYYIVPTFVISIAGGYQLYSYTNSDFGKYELVYAEYPITLMVYYVYLGNGYRVKLGLGSGPRFLTIDETLPTSTNIENYKTTGIGFLGRAEGNTGLGDGFYVVIGFDIMYDINGVVDLNDKNEVNFNTFALGINLGISYLIGGSN